VDHYLRKYALGMENGRIVSAGKNPSYGNKLASFSALTLLVGLKTVPEMTYKVLRIVSAE